MEIEEKKYQPPNIGTHKGTSPTGKKEQAKQILFQQGGRNTRLQK